MEDTTPANLVIHIWLYWRVITNVCGKETLRTSSAQYHAKILNSSAVFRHSYPHPVFKPSLEASSENDLSKLFPCCSITSLLFQLWIYPSEVSIFFYLNNYVPLCKFLYLHWPLHFFLRSIIYTKKHRSYYRAL